MKAYKAEVLILAFEDESEESVRYHLGNMKYMHADVMAIKSAEIGEWSDEHPLNQHATQAAEYARIFSS